jgi:CDGSH-type Zn-finger protein
MITVINIGYAYKIFGNRCLSFHSHDTDAKDYESGRTLPNEEPTGKAAGISMNTRKKNIRKATEETPKITVTKNGPYLVTGGVPLSEMIISKDEDGFSYEWREKKKYPLQENYTLCRCRKAKTLPFCDGMHEKTGFDGTETADNKPYCDQADRIKGPELNLTDFIDICASARFCDRAGGIWSLTRHSDLPESRSIAITEAGNCPSGRLAVWDKKTHDAIEPEFRPSIGLIEYPDKAGKGPLGVRGRIPIESAEGKIYEIRNRVTLCRCGRSENKPFCDSSHLEFMKK